MRSRCRWYTHLTNHGYFDYGKTRRPQFEPYASIKMVQVLGSPMYICEQTSYKDASHIGQTFLKCFKFS